MCASRAVIDGAQCSARVVFVRLFLFEYELVFFCIEVSRHIIPPFELSDAGLARNQTIAMRGVDDADIERTLPRRLSWRAAPDLVSRLMALVR